MTEIFLYIVNMSITASVLAVIVLLLRLLLKKAPKWVSVLLWGLVALRLICPFAVESPFSLMPKTDWIEEAPAYESENIVPDVIDTNAIAERYPGIEISTSVMPSPEITVVKVIDFTFLLPYIWLIGIAVMLLHTLISTIRLRRSVGAAIRLRDNVWESSAVDSPFVLGIFNPRIYVPRGMSEEKLDYVIAHEEAHISRRDHWWKPLGFLLLTVHWFNPVMWLSYILLCRDIEMACDERVVKEYDEGQRADYSEALLECSVKRSMISACPLAFGEVSVKQRIQSVLNYKKPAFWIVAVAVIACIVTAVCFLTNPGSLHFHGSVGAGLRFPSSDPSAAELCDISINGQIIRDEFKGTLSVDGRQMEVSIFMDNDTPAIGYYVGPRREIYGILLVCDDKLSRFALKTNDTSEYILYGMTIEEFEWEMKHRNYYVDYLHDVVLHDITVSDKMQVISDIHTEGRTVIIYGMDLDTDEINRTFFSGDNVMGTTEYLPSKSMRVFYACASTCLNGTVYIGYYSVDFPADANKADVMALLDDEYFTETTLFGIGYDFRNKKLDMLRPKTDPSVIKTDPLTEEKISLTLDDVITLSAKGTDLTWEDFAPYACRDVGSGLYICRYEIDDIFHLLVGDGKLTGTPMYIRLKLNDGDAYADVTKDDVAAFIREHTSAKISVDSSVSVPQPVLDYALSLLQGHIDTYNGYGESQKAVTGTTYTITEAKIMSISPFGTLGTAGLSDACYLYKMECLLKPTEADPANIFLAGGMLLEDGWFKIIQPYFAMYQSWSGGEEIWKPMGIIDELIIASKYGTAEMLDKYGNMYTAALMEMLGTFEGRIRQPITITELPQDTNMILEHHRYIHDESEYTRYILISVTEHFTNDKFTNVRLTSMILSENGMEPDQVHYTFPELTHEKPLLMGVVFYGDLTTYGLMFTDENGSEYRYMISESGKDGSVVLQQIE